jgi:hypothetical protein
VKGIIMSPESVRAILDNRKSQTRRVVKPQPVVCPCNPIYLDWKEMTLSPDAAMTRYCPYGKPGDVLYVKETWAALNPHSDKPSHPDSKIHVMAYRADEEDRYRKFGGTLYEGPWKSPLHMPEWASRLKIVLTDVRVERLQDISEDDAIAEGCNFGCDSVDWYRETWDSINAKRGYPWESNCWVWVLSFKRYEEEEG